MRGKDWGGIVTSTSSSSSEELDLVWVSSPCYFTAWWAAHWAFSFYFDTRMASLWTRFASCFTASLGRIMPHGALRAPSRPCVKS
jgi:hypothetical protein